MEKFYQKYNHENIMCLSNNRPVFRNNSMLTDSYICNSLYREFELTFHEKMMVTKYFREVLGFGYEKEIDFESGLVQTLVDFLRYSRAQF